jgi:hypothetical protein
MAPLSAPAPARHPLDPEPVRSTKATPVLVLGLAALVTGAFVGGIVPAVVALVLARQARADLAAARGFLTGGDRVRRGEIMALVGLGLGVLTLVVGAVAVVLAMADAAGRHDFPNRFD